MKKILSLLASVTLGLTLFLGAAQAADDAKTAQQNKMGACNADAKAKDLKGEERKKFMSSCLSAKKATQQDKMKSCNADAKGKTLKGDERKAYMKECLSK